MLSTLLVAGLLIAVGIGSGCWQVAARRSQLQQALAPYEQDFYARRHRRRLQISGLLGLVALAIVGGLWVHDPLLTGIYWLGVLLLLVWIILLAMVDASASHGFFTRLRARQLADRATLQRELLARHRPETDLS
jgi:hypothetical protein